jgi:hypothetical protein
LKQAHWDVPAHPATLVILLHEHTSAALHRLVTGAGPEIGQVLFERLGEFWQIRARKWYTILVGEDNCLTPHRHLHREQVPEAIVKAHNEYYGDDT